MAPDTSPAPHLTHSTDTNTQPAGGAVYQGTKAPRTQETGFQGPRSPRRSSATLGSQAEGTEIAPETLRPASSPTSRPLQTREAEGSPEDLELPSSLLLLKPCSRAVSGPAPAKKLGPVDVEKLWSVTSSWARPYTGGSPRANDLGALWCRAHGRLLINAES